MIISIPSIRANVLPRRTLLQYTEDAMVLCVVENLGYSIPRLCNYSIEPIDLNRLNLKARWAEEKLGPNNTGNCKSVDKLLFLVLSLSQLTIFFGASFFVSTEVLYWGIVGTL